MVKMFVLVPAQTGSFETRTRKPAKDAVRGAKVAKTPKLAKSANQGNIKMKRTLQAVSVVQTNLILLMKPPKSAKPAHLLAPVAPITRIAMNAKMDFIY